MVLEALCMLSVSSFMVTVAPSMLQAQPCVFTPGKPPEGRRGRNGCCVD